MSDDELNLLSLLIRRHGLRAVIAGVALSCGQLANEAVEEGEFRAEQHWKRYADLFQAVAAIAPKQNPSTE